MINKNNFFLLAIFLISLLSLSTVCAEDNNGTFSDNVSEINITNTQIDVNDINVVYGNEVNFEAKLIDDSGNSIDNETLNIKFLNNSYSNITDENGKVDINLGKLDIGNYTVKTFFNGTENYNKSLADSYINVLPSIYGNDITKYFRNDTQYYVTVLDKNGNPVKNTNITFEINGVSYKRPTNESGVARLSINLNPNEYIVKVINPVTNENISNKITVLSTISGSNVVKYYKNGTQFYVSIVDSQGKPVSNTNVSMNINGVFYKRTTNESGVARLNINLDPNKYILTAIDPNNGLKRAFNITVLPTISGSNVVKYYKNGTQFYVSIVDSQGEPVSNTNVSMNINGVFYKRTTNESGVARLNINLDPNKYILTAIDPNNGLKRAFNITVLPKIIGNDTTVDFQAGGKYSVKVLDDTGKAIPNAVVQFNINGVFYNRTANENGTASLNINLNPNKYIITTTYKDSVISNTVTVNKMKAEVKILNTTVKQNGLLKVKATSNDKPVSGVTIYYIFNKVAYVSTTDDNGIAEKKIGLPKGSYQFIIGINNDPFYQNTLLYNTIVVV